MKHRVLNGSENSGEAFPAGHWVGPGKAFTTDLLGQFSPAGVKPQGRMEDGEIRIGKKFCPSQNSKFPEAPDSCHLAVFMSQMI